MIAGGTLMPGYSLFDRAQNYRCGFRRRGIGSAAGYKMILTIPLGVDEYGYEGSAISEIYPRGLSHRERFDI